MNSEKTNPEIEAKFNTDWLRTASRFFNGGPSRSGEKQTKMAVEQKCSYRSLIQIERQLAN